jgi:hypothetical protein
MARKLGLGVTFLASALALTGCTVANGPAGPPGEQGDPGESGSGKPSVSAVTPTEAFLSRTLDVTISGSGTAWSDATTVTFGDPKITVNTVTVASPSALVVNVTIPSDATIGATDVTVNDGSDQVFAGGFKITSPLKTTVEGTLAQGSVLFVHARGLDFETPFDTTSTGDGFFTPLVYTYLGIDGVGGVSNEPVNASDYTVDYLAFVDVDAAVAAQDVLIQSGPDGDVVEFPQPGAYSVAARTPTDLAEGPGAKGTLKAPFESSLYSFTPKDAFSFVQFSASGTNPDAGPAFYLLPKSGKFGDVIGYFSGVGLGAVDTDLFHLVFVDAYGVADYDFTLKANVLSASAGGGEAEPNSDKAKALVLNQLPFVVLKASLADPDANPSNPLPLADWYAVTVTQADVTAGKKIRVITGGTDGQTDTWVDVVFPDGQTVLGDASDDLNYHENYLSDAPPAPGTYFVRIYESNSGYFDPAHDTYDAYIALE